MIQGWNLGTLTNKLGRPTGNRSSLGVQFAATDSEPALRKTLIDSEIKGPTDIVKTHSVDLPPAAVETDDLVVIDIAFKPGCLFETEAEFNRKKDKLDGTLTVLRSRRGTTIGKESSSLSFFWQEKDNTGLIIAQGSLGRATDFANPRGLGFKLQDIEVTAWDETVFSSDDLPKQSPRTYAFEHVNPLLYYPVRAKGQSPPKTGVKLYQDMREKAERTNEYFASELSSMGAHGMNFIPMTLSDYRPSDLSGEASADTIYDDGWIVLDGGTIVKDWTHAAGHKNTHKHTSYLPDDDQKRKQIKKKKRPGSAIRNHIRDEATCFVMDNDVVPQIHDRDPTLFFAYENRMTGGGEYYPNDRSGSCPYWSRVVSDFAGNTWLHELSHRQGFPDLYRGGCPGEWGMMGKGSTLPTYLRMFWDWVRWTYPSQFPDEYPSDDWLTPRRVELHDNESILVRLTRIADLSFGDTAVYLEVKIKESIANSGRVSDVVCNKYYVPEARKTQTTNGKDGTHVQDPPGNRLSLNPDPSNADGVALFDVGRCPPAKHDQTFPPHCDPQLAYIPPNGGTCKQVGGKNQAQPITLTNSPLPSEQHAAKYQDPETATTFRIGNSFDIDDNPIISLNRKPSQATRSSSIDSSVTFSVDRLTNVDTGGTDRVATNGLRVPALDITVKTTDGDIAGWDADAGAYVNEIPGADVGGSLGDLWVSVPLETDFEVTVSADRLRRRLESARTTVPSEIEYQRQQIVETDPTFSTNDDGVLVVDGRLVHEMTTTVGLTADSDAPVFTRAAVDVHPPKINPNSKGKFITVEVGVERDITQDDVDPGLFLLGEVPAVSDSQYGFVKNPPISHRNDRTWFELKFRRDAVVTEFDTGGVTTAVTGQVDTTTLVGPASFTIKSGNHGASSGEKNGE